jgi:PAS domain S-box-containing protein
MKDMSDTSSKLEEGVLTGLARALKTCSLYGLEHPSTREYIQSIGKLYQEFFEKSDTLEIASQDGKILLSGQAVEDKNPIFRNVINIFDKVGIMSLTFKKGLDENEISAFLKFLFGLTAKTETPADLETAFRSASLTHVEINSAVYTKIRKSELEEISKITGTLPPQTGGAVPQQKEDSVKEDLPEQFKKLSSLDKSRFLSKLLSHSEMIDQLLETGPETSQKSDPAEIFDSLCHHFLQKASKAGGQPIKVLKSFDRFKKNMLSKIEGKGLNQVQDGLQSTYDQLRAQILASQFLQSNQSQEVITEIAKKWIASPEELWRLIPQIKQILSEKGLGSIHLTTLIESLGKKNRVQDREIEGRLEKILSQYIPDSLQKTDAGNLIMEAVNQYVHSEAKKNLQELQETNLKLVQEKQRMETIFENVADGLVVTDSEGKIRTMNTAARALLGLAPEEAIDHDMLKKLMPGQVVAMTKQNSGNVAGGDGEFQLQGDAFTKKTLRQSVGVIRDEEGNVAGSIFTLSDVTRQREMIEKKAELFSNVVYDMRLSLTALKESVAVLSSQFENNISEDQKKLMEISQRGIQKLQEALTRLYQPSREEKNAGMRVKQWVDLESLIRKTMEGMDSWIASKKIQFETSFPEREILLELDLDQFLDLLHTFIAFKVKMTQPGGKIAIESRISVDQAETLEIVFKSSLLNEAAPALLKQLNQTEAPEERITQIFSYIGMKLPKALEALQSKEISCDIGNEDICLRLIIPDQS